MENGRTSAESIPVLELEDRCIPAGPGKPCRGHRTTSRDPQSGDEGAPQSSDWEVGTVPHPPLGQGGSTMVAERGWGPSARSGHESGSGRERSGGSDDYLTEADDGSGHSDGERVRVGAAAAAHTAAQAAGIGDTRHCHRRLGKAGP